MTKVRDALAPPVLRVIEESFEARRTHAPDSETINPFRRPVPDGALVKLWKIGQGSVGGTLVTNHYSGGNLDNAFAGNPQSVDDVLERTIPLSGLSAITKVYDRCQGITLGTGLAADAIWDGIRWIRHMWSGSSIGFVVKLVDRTRQRQLYDELVLHRRIVRDSPSSAQEHPGCSCWREIVGSGAQGMHLLIGDHSFPGLTEVENERLDELHIDWTSPCSPTSVDVCQPEFTSTRIHLGHVLLGIGVPDSPFNFQDVFLEVERAAKLGFVGSSAFSKAQKLKSQWDQSARIWAAQGYSGERQATALYDQLIAIREDALKQIQLNAMTNLSTGP